MTINKVKMAFGLCMALLIPLCLLTEDASARGRGSGPVPVIVAAVEQEAFSDNIQALGTTRANETVIITADTTEKITAIHFEAGQKVEAGELLVTLDQRQELAQLRAAKAQLDEARSAYQRAKNLQKRNALSAATVQERLAEKTRNEVQVDVIEARLAELRIQAPFSGVLGLRQVSVGALVKPGDPITTLDDLSLIKVDFQVPSRYLAVLKPGLEIEGKVSAFAGKVFYGQVQSVDTQIDTATRTVRLRAVLPNPEGVLKPGLLMTIKLKHGGRDTLLIPEEAIIKRGQNNYVYRVVPGATQSVAEQLVTLGARRAGRVEIITGLSAGEKVVVHGVNKLRPGAEIVVKAIEKANETLQQMLGEPSAAQGA